MAVKHVYSTLDAATLTLMRTAALSRLTSQQPVDYSIGGQHYKVWSVGEAAQMLQDVDAALGLQSGQLTNTAQMAFRSPYCGGNAYYYP